VNFEFTDKQKNVIDICRELAKDFSTRANEHDKNRSAPVENYEMFRKKGLYGIAIPEEYGGLGIGFLGYVASIIEIAKACASTANSFNMHANATGAILQHPDISEEVKERVADLAIKQEKLMCTSVSEPNSSSLLPTAYTPSLSARKVDGGYLLNGKKAFCSMVESSDYVYLYAHPENDPNPQASIGFLVPIDKGNAEGVTIHDVWFTHGMRATRSNTVEYNNVFIPNELYLHSTNEFINDFIMRGANWSFAGFAAVYLGIGLGILDFTSDFLNKRIAKGFAQQQAYHPDLRRRVGEMASDLTAAQYSMFYASWYSDHYGPGVETFKNFLRAKAAIGDSVSKATRSATIACGASSLMQGGPLERMIRDAATAPIMPPNLDAALDQAGILEMNLNPAEVVTPLKTEQELVAPIIKE
jgi:alkylation response protein AidB-like acyl-CoA dehydrogenase